jgi:hypothetical protein
MGSPELRLFAAFHGDGIVGGGGSVVVPHRPAQVFEDAGMDEDGLLPHPEAEGKHVPLGMAHLMIGAHGPAVEEQGEGAGFGAIVPRDGQDA